MKNSLKRSIPILLIVCLSFVSAQASTFDSTDYNIIDPNVGQIFHHTSADLDGDGRLDLLAGLYTEAKLVWYKNLGEGSFGEAQVIASGEEVNSVTNVEAVDIDNDGDLDVFSVNLRFAYPKLGWYENQGDGTFSERTNIGPTEGSAGMGYPRDLHLRDMDGDQDLDVFISQSANPSSFVWYENLGDAAFGPENYLAWENAGNDSYFADIDGDQDEDFVFWRTLPNTQGRNSELYWMENVDNVFETFHLIRGTDTGNNIRVQNLWCADIDGDGDNDVITGERDYGPNPDLHYVGFYENLDGLGNFGEFQNISSNMEDVRSISAADLDLDGDIDIVSTSYDGKVAWYENLGSSFGDQHLISEQILGATTLYLEDYDADGDIDVSVSGFTNDQLFLFNNRTINQVDGCTDTYASNYNPDATDDDGSCTYLDNGGFALGFDGVDDYARAQFQTTMSTYSVTMWVKNNELDQARNSGAFNNYAGSGGGFQISTEVGRLWSYHHSAHELTFGETTLEWTHLALTADGDSSRAYYNGNLVDVNDLVRSDWNQIVFGRNRNSDTYLKYDMDNVSLWDRALTENEVEGVMENHPQDTAAGLIGNWKFNEGEGTIIYDHSGSGNHMTIYNGAVYGANAPKVIISEIHYNPSSAQGSDFDFEFIELYNSGPGGYDLSGHYFSQGFEYSFPDGSVLPSGDYMVLAIGDTLVDMGILEDVVIWTSGNLSNSGESIEIKDSNGVVVDYVDYEDGSNDYGDWGTSHDGGGGSLELIDPSLDNSLATSWQTSWVPNGTPGSSNSVEPDPLLTSIYNIQYTTDPNGASSLAGEYVETSGTVTAIDTIGTRSTFVIQDSSAAWNGIYCWWAAPEYLMVGDSVTVRGFVAEYNGYGDLGDPNQGMTQLNTGYVVEVHSSATNDGEEISGFLYVGRLNDSYYYRSTSTKNWNSASQDAQAHGGHLATISSQEENEFLGNGGWIGFNDQASEGQWVWVTGEEVVYTQWGGNEPNNQGNEDCGQRYGGVGNWNDANCGGQNNYFLEIPVETSNVFEPVVVSMDNLVDEKYEGVLVTTQGTVTQEVNDDSNGEYVVSYYSDASVVHVRVNDRFAITDPDYGSNLTITGVVNQWGGSDSSHPSWRLEPTKEDDVIINDMTQVSSPANFTASGGNGWISLSWDVVSGATYYGLWAGTEHNNLTYVDQISASETNFLYSNLENNVRYYFDLVAFNSIGIESAPSRASGMPYDIGSDSYSLHFDGVDDYVKIIHSAVQNIGEIDGNEGTIVASVKRSFSDLPDNQWPRIVSNKTYWSNPEGYELEFHRNDNHYNFNSQSGSQANGEFESDGAWEHVAVVFSDTTAIVYLNGNDVTKDGRIDPVLPSSDDFWIGLFSGGDTSSVNCCAFDGWIDEVALYSSALSTAEVQEIVLNGVQINEEVQAYYDFDQGNGVVATDLSGNENHGTIYGASWSSDVSDNNFSRITFNFDLRDQDVHEDGVHIAGHFNGWEPNVSKMTDADGDGVYTYEGLFHVGDTIQYKFINGSDWDHEHDQVEDPSCGGSLGYNNRWLAVPDFDVELDPACISSCVECSDEPIDLTDDIYFTDYTITQIGQDIEGTVIQGRIGEALAINSNGTRMIIGNRLNSDLGTNVGKARVYELADGVWSQLGSDIDGEYENGHGFFGYAVDISSDGLRVAISAPISDENPDADQRFGKVYVFDYNGNDWVQIGNTITGEFLDELGYTLSMNSDGSRIAVGIFKDVASTGNNAGTVKVFDFDGTDWNQTGIIEGETAFDWLGFGVSISKDGNTLAVGANSPWRDGYVEMYRYDGSNWNQIGQRILDQSEGDDIGAPLSLSSDGNRVAIGASGNDENGAESGHVRIFDYNGESWVQVGHDIYGESASDKSGAYLSISGDGSRIAIGAPGNDDAGANAGHLRVFEYMNDEWLQVGNDVDGNSGEGYGTAIKLSNDGLVVATGAPFNSDNGTNSGQVNVFQLPSAPKNYFYPQSDHILARYDFSGNADDLSGNGHHGTPQGGVSLADDKDGNTNSAYYLDGSNGTRIHCGSGIELANKSHTISIMAKQDDSNHHGHFFGHGAPGSSTGLHCRTQGGAIRYGFWNNDLDVNNTYSSSLDWHHYVFVYDYDLGTRKVYIDGNLMSPVGENTSPYIGTGDFAIGSINGYSNDPSWIGSLDDVIIWDVALSEPEIRMVGVVDSTDDNCQDYLDGFTYLGSFDEHCYYESNESLTWENAKIQARVNGGYLATISSQEENDLLTGSVSWIGLSDVQDENIFLWINGEDLDYTNWNTNEPNNSGDEDYVHLNGDGSWNDAESNVSLTYIMETDQNEIIVSDMEWSLQLRAWQGPFNDYENYLGVSDEATNSFDIGFDQIVSESGSSSSVSVGFVNLQGYNYDIDTRPSLSLSDTMQVWEFDVNADFVDGDIFLDFVYSDSVPDVPIILENLSTGHRHHIEDSSPFSFYAEAGNSYSFKISIGDTTDPTLVLGDSFDGPKIIVSDSTHNLTWDAGDGFEIDSLVVLFSNDGGSSFIEQVAFGGAQNSVDWLVPDYNDITSAMFMVRVKDYSGNMVEKQTQHHLTIVGDSLGSSISEGWTLWGAPMVPDNDSMAENLDDDISGYWSTFDYVDNGYTYVGELKEAEGYWLASLEAAEIDVVGTPVASDYTLSLSQGWDLISNPLVLDVIVDSLVFTKDGGSKLFSDAVSEGWINTVYGYNGSGYETSDMLSAWSGYWIAVLDSGISVTIPVHDAPVQQERTDDEEVQENWMISISASTENGLKNDLLSIGYDQQASDGFDPAFDAFKPPVSANPDHVSLFMLRPEWGHPFGDKFVKDIRSDLPESGFYEWRISLESSESQAALGWTITDVPEEYEVGYSLDGGGFYHDLRSVGDDDIITISVGSDLIVRVGSSVLGIGGDPVPDVYALKQNYPNPFNPITKIQYQLPQDNIVKLSVYDIMGRKVKTLVNSTQSAGYKTIVWDATNDQGSMVSAGMYIYTIEAGDFRKTKKMILLK